MKILLAVLLLASAAFAQSDTLYVSEVDGVTQTNRPIDFGRLLKAGEIPSGHCPQPLFNGVAVPDGSFQADIKNAYSSDSSAKFAIISFPQTLTAQQSGTISIQSGTCNNTGFLTQAQMVALFGSGDIQLVVTPSTGSAVTKSAKTLVGDATNDPGANTYGDCKSDYWRKGPVVTSVRIQDCTSATAYDFGWAWNGTVMGAAATANCSGSGATNCASSIHPIFDCDFYPLINAIACDVIVMVPWTGRWQDQQVTIDINAGSALTNVVHVAQFTMARGQKHTWRVWTLGDGTGNAKGPGQVRFDHNLQYLGATRQFPNQDPTARVSCDTAFNSGVNKYSTSYSAWAGGDKGKPGGFGGLNDITKDMSSNSEGAPLQREEGCYLQNMSASTSSDGLSCANANSQCAKAWQMLTGESGLIDTSLTSGNLVGGGAWGNFGNIPFHVLESRTTAGGLQGAGSNFFYCPTFAGINATTATNSCGGSGALNFSTGKPFSKHAHSNNHFNISSSGGILSAPTGTTGSAGGWTSLGPDHWQDWSYVPYVLTGRQTFLDDQYASASYTVGQVTEGTGFNNSANFFGFVASDNVIRSLAWAMQTTWRAANIAPDGSVESSYYTSMLNSNLEVLEGAFGVTGTSLTPSTTNPTCGSGVGASAYSSAAANRWDWGRCTFISRLTATGTPVTPGPLHQMEIGNCANTGQGPSYTDPTKAASVLQAWMYWYLTIALGEIRNGGFSNATSASNETLKALAERIGDSTWFPSSSQENNPYAALASYIEPAKAGDSTVAGFCTPTSSGPYSTAPYTATYTAWMAEFTAAIRAVTSFNTGTAITNNPCEDHGYSLDARAACTYLKTFASSFSFAGCQGGLCDGPTIWDKCNSEIPFQLQSTTHSATCSSGDAMIKFSQAPNISPDSCTISAPAAGATVNGATVAITIACTAGQGSINNIQATLNSSPTNMPSSGSSPLSSTFDSTLLSNGTYTLGCTSTDTGTGTGTCPTQNVTIFNTPVIQSIIKNGATVSGGAQIK